MFSKGFQVLRKGPESFWHSLIFFPRLLDTPLPHKILELLVSAEAKHFLAAADRIASTKSRMDNAKERLELIRARVQEDVNQFLSNRIRTPV